MNKNTNFRKAVAVLALFLALAGTHLFFYAQNMVLTYGNRDRNRDVHEHLYRNRDRNRDVHEHLYRN